MPCLRGIEIALYSNASCDRFPEYPHPDGTSIRLASSSPSRTLLTPRGSSSTTPPTATPRSSGQVLKTDPRVSVYIPSHSGSQFCVQYEITKVPSAPCKFMFFKLYMNGRLITAWGCDLEDKLGGSIARTFWAPAGQWRNDVGIEGRQFMFMPGLESRSAADDGGLIEVQAFRAKDRKLRAPKLESFRHQEPYGIAAPSIGMIDNPEDVTFYQWHLLDPKDSPYARFAFHYRTMENLKQLSLIPPTPRSRPGLLGQPHTPTTVIRQPNAPQKSEDEPYQQESCLSFFRKTYQSISPKRASLPVDGTEGEEVAPKKSPIRRRFQNALSRTPPPLRPLVTKKDLVLQPSKTLRDGAAANCFQRPLPELPVDTPTKMVRSASSTASLTPSLSPSVEQSFEDRVFDNDDHIEIGETKHVHIKKVTEKPTCLEFDKSLTDVSVPDYKVSLPLTDTCPSPPRDLPEYQATSGTSLQRGFELFSIQEVSDHAPSPTRPPPPIPTSQTLSPTKLPSFNLSDKDGTSPHKTYADTRAFTEWIGRTTTSPRRAPPPPVTDRWSYPGQRDSRRQALGFRTSIIFEDDTGIDRPATTLDPTFEAVKENMPPGMTELTDSDGDWI